MTKTITFVGLGDWHMMFAGDECLRRGHSLDAKAVARSLMDVEYDEIRSWDGTAHRTDVEFVDNLDQVPMYLNEHGVSVLFDDD